MVLLELDDFLKYKNNAHEAMGCCMGISHFDVIRFIEEIMGIPKCMNHYQLIIGPQSSTSTLFIFVQRNVDGYDYILSDPIMGERKLHITKHDQMTINDSIIKAEDLSRTYGVYYYRKFYYADLQLALNAIIEAYASKDKVCGIIGNSNQGWLIHPSKQHIISLYAKRPTWYIPRYGIRKKIFLKDMKKINFNIRNNPKGVNPFKG